MTTADHIFTSLVEALENPETARVLRLTGDELTLPEIDLPSEIGRLTALEELSLRGYQAVHLPPEIRHLQALRRLDIESLAPSDPFPTLGLDALEELRLCSSGGAVPASVARMVGLTALELEGFAELPEEITRLPALVSLSIHCPPVRTFPGDPGRLTALRRLDLRGCGLQSLPRSICRLVDLEHLDISHTFIDELPLEIAELKNLRTLRFAKPFPHHDAAKHATRVKQIRRSWTELKSLEILDLAHQQIMDVSSHVADWAALENLDLSYNDMDALPEEFLALTGLKRLDLSFNRIPRLPDGVGDWTELEELSLIDNPMTELPEALLGLKQLRVLDLRRIDLSPSELERAVSALPGTDVRHHTIKVP